MPGGTPTPFYGCPYCEGSTPPSTRSTAHPKGAPPPPAPPAPSHPAQHLPLPGVPTVCPPPPQQTQPRAGSMSLLKNNPGLSRRGRRPRGRIGCGEEFTAPPAPPPLPSACVPSGRAQLQLLRVTPGLGDTVLLGDWAGRGTRVCRDGETEALRSVKSPPKGQNALMGPHLPGHRCHR